MKKAYQTLLDCKQLEFDAAQYCAVDALAELTIQLEHAQKNQYTGSRFTQFFSYRKKTTIPGLYFYGRVGRGKTMLMDLFYQHVNIKKKKRLHFHHFIESVHQQLDSLVGTINPLETVAKTWAKEFAML